MEKQLTSLATWQILFASPLAEESPHSTEHGAG